ncbi:unnamed protein product [Gongylonema pulchrum]|uniref:pyridoxal 5'-phosphate synthase n=1 Tax=Gongylonema pulchrum TaxID=637853 RepID=A0A3P7N772_9BILA|nr:unnamed protein product [Gongylonema pulchrum]
MSSNFNIFLAWRKPYFNSEEPFLLEENLPSKNPFEIFDIWLKNVAAKKDVSFEEVNAACFSTVRDFSAFFALNRICNRHYFIKELLSSILDFVLCFQAINNRPKSRMVLIKEYDMEGFSFYTHYKSAKGREIDANPYGCILFYWPAVDRQASRFILLRGKQKSVTVSCQIIYFKVRVEGKIEKLPLNAAESYWYQRPLKSRIGSKLSNQSAVIPSRQYLEEQKKILEKLAAEKGEAAITRPDDWGGYRLLPDYFEFWQGQSDRVHDRIVFEKANGESEWTVKRLSP